MKLIDTYTAKGIIDRDIGVKRISLFDGRFDTAFRIVSVKCAVSDLSSANEAYMVVSTEATGRAADNWNWGDNLEIGWAYFKTSLGANEGAAFYSNVDDENMIVEDLYVQVASDAGDINYEIKMEKYDITSSQGALSMVNNRSQG